jgi:hypothetical protein
MVTLLDSYAGVNRDAQYAFATGAFPTNYCARGQTFKTPNDGINYTLVSGSFWLDYRSALSGIIRVDVYAHTGTYGAASGLPTGAVLASSETKDTNSIANGYHMESFAFSGANQITLTANTPYALALKKTADPAGGKVNYGQDNSTPTHGGQTFYYFNAAWVAVNPSDSPFEVYGEVPDTYNPASRSATLGNTMATMLNSKMFFSALKKPKFQARCII